MAIAKAYEEVVDFIARGNDPQAVIEFQPLEEARRRVRELIAREKDGGLIQEEASELGHCLQLEHLMRLAKTRARQYLSTAILFR